MRWHKHFELHRPSIGRSKAAPKLKPDNEGRIKHLFKVRELRNYDDKGYKHENYLSVGRMVSDADCGAIGTGYTRAFGNGPRHFEPWSSEEDDT
ncbi:hypothetical protein TNCV_5062921 [Trichonephila clavipes]|nr:hypothetical protein TNCV_5062921 [Trichonephila clavipes]